jgi:alpha-glucosidase
VLDSTPNASARDHARLGDDWWRRGVIYQVYPRSFADSDGDGLGDLGGLIEHLDHLGPDGLGIDAIWLSPIYPSPGVDGGYDVSDHTRVDPQLGGDEAFDRLLREAHRRGIRVILDLVMNHTSDQHPWFVASRQGRDGPDADRYIWRDPSGTDRAGRPVPPNNWVSWFGGPAWTFDPGRGQFFHHTFLAEQPEVDWRVPAVEAAMFDMVRGWLARGVDGFRLDTFNVFLKDPAMRSNPTRAGATPWTRQAHRYDIDQPDLPELIERFRAVVDAEPGRMSVGELFVGKLGGAVALTRDRHLVFDWDLMGVPWDAKAMRATIERRERAFGPDRWPTAVLSNHDQPRHASRLANSAGVPAGPAGDAIAKAAAAILLTIRGTPFLYYGEELGMRDVAIPLAESVDPPAAKVGPDFAWWDRSQSRTPMPWTDSPRAGFTTGRPWLRLGPDVALRNVAAQAADPTSVLSWYRTLLRTRRELRALQDGAMRVIALDDAATLAWRRGTGDDEVLVLVRFSGEPGRIRLPRSVAGPWRRVAGTRSDGAATLGDGEDLELEGHEVVVAARPER